MNHIFIISAIGMAQILSWGSSYYLPAVLAAPISADTGWPLEWVTGALSIALLVSGLISPRVGRLIEKYGGKPVLASGALLIAFGQLTLGLSRSLPFFLAGWFIMGLGMGSALYNPAFSTLGKLYGEKARSAITHVTLFGGFASTVCWPLTAFLAAGSGWRNACFFYSALHILAVVPVYLFVIPSGESKSSLKGAQESNNAGKPAGSGGKDDKKAFFLLALGQTLASVVMTVISVHLINILQLRGISLAAAVGMGTLLGPSQVGARIIEAAFGRKLHPVWSLFIAIIAVTAGIAIMAGWPGIIAAGIILYGAGNGLRSITAGTVPLALFGRKGYAVIMGKLTSPVLVAQALSPLIGTFLINSAGAYKSVIVLLSLSVLNVFIVVLLLPYACNKGNT